MKKSLIKEIEHQELIEKLTKNGYGDIVGIFIDKENKVYTKKGRLNKSGACRQLGLTPKQLEEKLEQMKELLKNDIDH